MRAVFLMTSVAAASACTGDTDCQLNGACTNGVCVCDKGWKSANCGILNLDGNANYLYGYNATSNFSSWGGGPPVLGPNGKYHLYISEIAAHCGMSTWSRMSTSSHAISDKVNGPYTKVKTIVGTESHNTIYVYSPVNKMHLIYTIKTGTSPESCNPYLKCANGTTPGGHALHPPAGWAPSTCSGPGGYGVIHSATDVNGPWTNAGAFAVAPLPKRPDTAGTSNPSPYIFPNGTVLLIGRGKDATRYPNGTVERHHNIFLYRAPHWNATYEWVPSDGVKGAINVGAGNDGPSTEDPHFYRGRRGFHILFHSSPDFTHAWSEDGLTWAWNKTISGPPTHGAGYDNERPRVVLDANRDLDWLFTGQLVGTTAGGGDDGARTAAFQAL